MTKSENIKDINTTVGYLKGATSEQYKNAIIAIICLEKDIIATNDNIELLESIYQKWFDSDYQLLNDVFCDEAHELFNDKERELLGL